MVRAAPALSARLGGMAREMTANLAATLAEGTGAGPGDPLPRLLAGQLGWAHEQVFREIGARTAAGEDPDRIAETVLGLIDIIESLLGERVLTYAAREA